MFEQGPVGPPEQDEVDVIIEVASWRGVATRDYPGMNVRTDLYYGELWDNVMSASSATSG